MATGAGTAVDRAKRTGMLRWLAPVAGVVVVGLIWGVSRWASAPVYVTLYRDLEFKEAAEVDDGLTRADIPHQLTAGGTEIKVPVAEVARARVALARGGHAVGGRPGMELFDKPAWGMTDFTQRVTYQRAIEGELARTISGLRGIDRAEVHLAIPAPTPFKRDEKKPSASVVLKLKSGTLLPAETVHGIAYIVSNSVEGMAPEDVALMDDSGHILSSPAGEDGLGGATHRQLEIEQATESALAAKVMNLLEPILGTGRVKVEVNAQLSFDKIDRAVESLGPYSGESNGEVPDSLVEVPAAGPNDYARAYERKEGSVGKLERLTAAVLIDQAALPAAADTASAAALPRIEAMVRDALGLDDERGDRLSVAAVPFQPVAPPAEEKEKKPGLPLAEIAKTAERILRPVVGLAALVVLLLLAFRVMKMPPAAAPMAPVAAAVEGSAALAAAVARGSEAGAGAAAHGGTGNGNGRGMAVEPAGGDGSTTELTVVRDWLRKS